MNHSLCTVKGCPNFGRYCREHELWQEVENYPNYEVSNFGRVRSKGVRFKNPLTGGFSLKKGRVLKPIKKATGYLQVNLYNENGPYAALVHILVGNAFIPEEPGKLWFNHKFGDKEDNREWMLERCTCAENNLHAYRVLGRPTNFTGRSYVKKPIVQKDLAGNVIKTWESCADAARHLKVKACAVNSAVLGKNKTCKGFKFERA